MMMVGIACALTVVSSVSDQHNIAPKPDIVYELIEAMYDGSKIELFARKQEEKLEIVE